MIIEARKTKKLKVDDDNRRCCICGNIFPNDQIKYNQYCEDCREDFNRHKYQLDLKRKDEGSRAVKPKPYTYIDDEQREDVELFLSAFGYTKNEQTGEWYKEPWKSKDGTFPLIGEIIKRNKQRKREKIKELKCMRRDKKEQNLSEERKQLVISFLPMFEQLQNFIINKNRDNIKSTILFLHDSGLSYKSIGKQLGITIEKVYNYSNYKSRKTT